MSIESTTTLPLPDENELLVKLAKGDERVFKVVYEKFSRRIFTVSIKILQSDLMAEEITQETFFKLWRHNQVFNSFDHMEAWLRATVRNLSLNAFRRVVLEKRADKELTQNFRDCHNETEESILMDDARNVLNAAIEKLPTQQKEVYILCQQDGLKYEEVAEKLNISVNTVKTHMKRALSTVRGYVKSHIDVAAILILLKLF